MSTFRTAVAAAAGMAMTFSALAQDAISEQSSGFEYLPPIQTSFLREMKIRVYEFNSQIKDGVRKTEKGLYDPVLSFFCTWTEASRENTNGETLDVKIVSHECDVVEDERVFLNKRIVQNFGAGYVSSTGPVRKITDDGDVFEVVERRKNSPKESWMEAIIRDWSAKENTACIRYMVFQGDNSENAIAKDEQVIEQCVQFDAEGEYNQFKAKHLSVRPKAEMK